MIEMQKWTWTLTMREGEPHGTYRQVSQEGDVLEYPVDFDLRMYPEGKFVIRWDTKGARMRPPRKVD